MDQISTTTLFLLLIFLVILSAYFSSSETGIMSINRYRLRHLAKEGHPGAKRVEKLLANPDRLIGLILIGNNLVNILASFIASAIGIRYGNMGTGIAAGALTFVILVFAEVTPKTLAALHPEKVAYISSIFLVPLLKIMYPLVWLMNLFVNMLLRVFGIHTIGQDKNHLSTDELRTVVNEAGSLIPRRHQEMLLSILDLENVAVDDIMIPRNEIDSIDINDDWKSIQRQVTHSAHSRILLYRDNIDDVVGILRVREAYRIMMEKREFTKDTLLRGADEIYFIPEGTPLNVQLLKFQRNKRRLGIVVDEYGDIQGLITLEDIIKEIIGEFSHGIDEDYQPLSDGTLFFDGSTNIRDINKNLNWDLPTDGPRTLNGLILEYLEDIPDHPVSLKINGHKLEIVSIADNRIEQVKLFGIPKK